MVIYVARSGSIEGEDYILRGLFSTRQNAEQWVKTSRYPDMNQIDEVEVDKKLDEDGN